MNEIAYRPPAPRADYGLEQGEATAPMAVPLAEDAVQRIVAEVRRDLQAHLEWQRTARRGPSPTEAAMMLGSLATGAVITGILATDATTVVSGFLGTQSATHLDTLPLIVVVWAALFCINLVWARRR